MSLQRQVSLTPVLRPPVSGGQGNYHLKGKVWLWKELQALAEACRVDIWYIRASLRCKHPQGGS